MRSFHGQCSAEGPATSPTTTDDGLGEEDFEIHDRVSEMENPSGVWDHENKSFTFSGFKESSEFEEEVISWLPNESSREIPASGSTVSVETDGAKTAGEGSNKRPHRPHSLEPVIVPRRRLATGGSAKSSSAALKHCGRWTIGGFPARDTLAIEMAKGFRAPASRAEPATRDRVLGGVSESPCPAPDEDLPRPRTCRDGDKSRERLFGASEELLRQGVKEWPVRSYRQPRHRPRPGDDSRRQVCWWIEVPAEELKQTYRRRLKVASSQGTTGDRVFGLATEQLGSPLAREQTHEDRATPVRLSLRRSNKASRNPISGEGVPSIASSGSRGIKIPVQRNPISGDGIGGQQLVIRNSKKKIAKSNDHNLFDSNPPQKTAQSSAKTGETPFLVFNVYSLMETIFPTSDGSISVKRNPIIGEGCDSLGSHLRNTSKRSDSRLNPITGEPAL